MNAPTGTEQRHYQRIVGGTVTVIKEAKREASTHYRLGELF